MSSRDHAAGIAGLCFLAAAALMLAALAGSALTHYGPMWREAILALFVPQFAFGVYVGLALATLALLLWRGRR